jgi:hypothetical protein
LITTLKLKKSSVWHTNGYQCFLEIEFVAENLPSSKKQCLGQIHEGGREEENISSANALRRLQTARKPSKSATDN